MHHIDRLQFNFFIPFSFVDFFSALHLFVVVSVYVAKMDIFSKTKKTEEETEKRP